MKGLLLKDLLIMKTQVRSLVIIVAIALFMMMTGNNISFAVVYANILFVMFGITTLSYDTHDNGYAFLFTLPISRKLYVLEKYVFSLLSIVTGAVISTIMMIGVSFIKDNYALTTYEFAFVVGYAMGALVFVSIMIPINLKFGPEKARIVMVVVMAIVAAGILSMSKIVGTMDFTGFVVGISAIPPVFAAVFLGVVALAIIGASLLISCKIMENKEF